MKTKTTSKRHVEISATGPLANQDVWLEAARELEAQANQGGWMRLMNDLFADEKIGRAKQALSKAAAQVDTNDILTQQMLNSLRAA